MLENVENERDLGVWISNNLTWRKRVLEQCSKANKMWVSSKDQQEQSRTVKPVGRYTGCIKKNATSEFPKKSTLF
jgi:hypothetical protein